MNSTIGLSISAQTGTCFAINIDTWPRVLNKRILPKTTMATARLLIGSWSYHQRIQRPRTRLNWRPSTCLRPLGTDFSSVLGNDDGVAVHLGLNCVVNSGRNAAHGIWGTQVCFPCLPKPSDALTGRTHLTCMKY